MTSQSVSQFPAEPAQRISQQFWNSEPAYSEPPNPIASEAPPAIVKSPKRGLFAKLLFATLFLPVAALLAHLVMQHYSSASPVLTDSRAEAVSAPVAVETE